MDRRRKKIMVEVGLLLLIASSLLLELWRLGTHGKSHAPAAPVVVAPAPPAVVAPAAPAVVAPALPQSEPVTEETWMKDHAPALLTKAQLQDLYQSLVQGYYVPQTGLFLSFPRTGDIRLIQQAATYDQGVIGILLLRLGDLKRVKGILTFYEKAWNEATERSGPRQGVYGLANFYNGYFGVEGIEKTMHVGPNAWIGLLASRYYRRTGDAQARDLALQIAHWMIEKVPHENGAIAMGQIPWNSAPWNKIHSTENNLSTYVFLGDLLKATKLKTYERVALSRERERIGEWLIKKAYQPGTHTILRGFHRFGADHAGAIDSYTWYLTALRPEVLESRNIPVEALLKRARKDFTVHVDGHDGIDAVDADMAEATYHDAINAHYKDLNFYRPAAGEHRLIWYEGQGQYIVALQDMAQHAVHRAFLKAEGKERDAWLQKASAWFQEARHYTQAMDKVLVSGPWGNSYPCATKGRFYLYGWPAPDPMEGHLADASAPLVWRLFAGMGYEPLTDTQLQPSSELNVKSFAWRSVRDPGTAILYGASEEMMVQAWKLYEHGDTDGAGRQAKATIALWEADAHELQKAKSEKIGTYLPFDGTVEGYQRIHNYWALNDVAACYFILGKIADQQKNYPEAYGYFAKILKDFYLAQLWDKRGWFWDPVGTIHADYVEADAKHYAGLDALIPEIPALTVAQEQEYQARHATVLSKIIETQPPLR